MKRLFAACAALLLLTACGQTTDEPPIAETNPDQIVEEQTPAEPEVEEIPMEINPDLPACEDGVSPEGEQAVYEVVLVEGLIEDSVGYTIEKPVFKDLNGADNINAFYETIVLSVENFCKSQIYDTAMNKSTVASAYGTVDFATIYEDYIEIQYRFKAEYGDDTVDENVRNDRFDLETGEKIEQ